VSRIRTAYSDYEKSIKNRQLQKRSDDKIHVYVPIKNVTDDTDKFIEILLNQVWLPDQYIFIVEDENDPAYHRVKPLANDNSIVELVVAGKTTARGQKNHNLLAGINAFPDAEYYVFCDADILPSKLWLYELVSPLLESDKFDAVSTHHWVERRPGIGNFFLTAILAYFIALGSNQKYAGGIWGGSTAIRRKKYDALQIANLWSNTVVDDVTVHKLSISGKLRCLFRPELLINSKSNKISFPTAIKWLTRQTTWLKFYTFSEIWLPILFVHILLSFGYLSILVLPLFIFLNWNLVFIWLAALIPTLFHMILFPKIRRIKREDDESYWYWLKNIWLCVFVSGLVMIYTIFTNTINWAGKSYKMTFNGRVKKIIER